MILILRRLKWPYYNWSMGASLLAHIFLTDRNVRENYVSESGVSWNLPRTPGREKIRLPRSGGYLHRIRKPSGLVIVMSRRSYRELHTNASSQLSIVPGWYVSWSRNWHPQNQRDFIKGWSKKCQMRKESQRIVPLHSPMQFIHMREQHVADWARHEATLYMRFYIHQENSVNIIAWSVLEWLDRENVKIDLGPFCAPQLTKFLRMPLRALKQIQIMLQCASERVGISTGGGILLRLRFFW